MLYQRDFNGVTKFDARFKETPEQVLHSVPTEFRWQRTTNTRELLGRGLERPNLLRVDPRTMGRALSAIGARLRMPEPFVSCLWASGRRQRVLRVLHCPARSAAAEEPVVFKDEVDVHLNPKTGRDTALKGHRHHVRTQGARPEVPRRRRAHCPYRQADLGGCPQQGEWTLLRLVCRLSGRYRHARRIQIMSDTHIIHASKGTKRFLAQFGDRVELHLPSRYCTDDNRIERVWLHQHANVTRNHLCLTIGKLMVQGVAFVQAYKQWNKLNSSLELATVASGSRSVVLCPWRALLRLLTTSGPLGEQARQVFDRSYDRPHCTRALGALLSDLAGR